MNGSSGLSGRRVVLTGGSGFLGRRVDAEFRSSGAQVMVARKKDYDLVEREACRRLLNDTHPDVVVHLAARVGGIGANRENPGLFFFENLMMGAQLVEECRLARVSKVVTIGTICSYPTHTPVPFKEEALGWIPGRNQRAVRNRQEDAARPGPGLPPAVRDERHSPLPVNLYGPGDNFDPATSHVIPALIKRFDEAVRAGLPVVDVWGTGAASREFLHVDDAARGIRMATEAYDGLEPVNLSAGFEITIHELTQLIARLIGFTGDIRWDTSKPDGQPRRSLDTTKAESLFGFRAEIGFEEAAEDDRMVPPAPGTGAIAAPFSERTQPATSVKAGRRRVPRKTSSIPRSRPGAGRSGAAPP